ncbi:MAG: glutamine amidotransferase-related protein [Alphaproteobacteria bacterium]
MVSAFAENALRSDKLKPIAILNADKLSRTLPQLHAVAGEFDAMFTHAAGLQDMAVLPVDIYETDMPLPDHGEISGVIISGSGAMVTDRHDWAERAAAWMRTGAALNVPTLGVCFGFQLLAHALGGVVEKNANGPVYGTQLVTPTPKAGDDPLLSILAAPTNLQAGHNQRVAVLPPGAELLATGDAGHYAARFAANVWGVQPHPEFSASAMQVILEAIRPRLEPAGVNVDANIAAVEETPQGPALLQRFRDLVVASQ